MLICMNDEIVLYKLQKTFVSWYHTYLCDPGGETRSERSIRQHFWFMVHNLRDVVHEVCKKCIICQRKELDFKMYGNLSAKVAESEPWEILCVDLIGP